MKKVLVLSLLVVAAVACGKKNNNGPTLKTGNTDTTTANESEINRANKNEAAPTDAELTANGWCEQTESETEAAQSMVFSADSKVKVVVSLEPDDQGQREVQTFNGTYTLSNGRITISMNGASQSAVATISQSDNETSLKILADGDTKNVVYVACDQQAQ